MCGRSVLGEGDSAVQRRARTGAGLRCGWLVWGDLSSGTPGWEQASGGGCPGGSLQRKGGLDLQGAGVRGGDQAEGRAVCQPPVWAAQVGVWRGTQRALNTCWGSQGGCRGNRQPQESDLGVTNWSPGWIRAPPGGVPGLPNPTPSEKPPSEMSPSSPKKDVDSQPSPQCGRPRPICSWWGSPHGKGFSCRS